MSPIIIFSLRFGTMLALLLTGRQIVFIVGAIAAIAGVALWGWGGVNMAFYATFNFMKWFVIITIPLFVFMALVLSRSGIADKLFQALYLWMGPVKGGLAMADVGLSCLVAAMSGLNVASTVTSATISLPAMLKRKYDKRIAVGIVLAGGGLGFLIPPSIIFIVYAVIAKVSVGHLWLAGVFPGIILATPYIIYICVSCRLNPKLGPAIPLEERVGWGEKFRALTSGIAPVILIFAVLGLLFMGMISLIECSAIGAAGSMVLAAINRRLTWKLLKDVTDETLRISAMFLWIVAAALFFGAIFDGVGAVDVVGNIITGLTGGNRYLVIVAMMVSWIFLGTVLDDTAMLIIVAPLFIPIVANLGFSLVWFGVLYVLNCQMAYITPPFGYNLFILKGILPKDSGITIRDIYRSVFPFVGIQAAVLALIVALPQLALWLPSVVFQVR